jgi:hypothetical protein
LNLTVVNLNLTGVRFYSTRDRLNLTAERLRLTAVSLNLTGVRFDSTRVRFNLTTERLSLTLPVVKRKKPVDAPAAPPAPGAG